MREPYLLASASPRRLEICRLAGIPVEVRPALHEPPLDPALPPADAVLALARAKAEEVAARFPGRVVIGADTMGLAPVTIRPLGKPASAQAAADMLRLLQGRPHTVVTGVWVCSDSRSDGFAEEARVTFYPMTEDDIAAYVATGEPMDKAGAYGIQGHGMRYIRGIEGDFYTVMGLPGARLWRFLQSFDETGR